MFEVKLKVYVAWKVEEHGQPISIITLIFFYKFILNFKSSNLILKNIIIIYQPNVKFVCDFENIQKPIKLLKFFFDWPRPYLNSL